MVFYMGKLIWKIIKFRGRVYFFGMMGNFTGVSGKTIQCMVLVTLFFLMEQFIKETLNKEKLME